MASDAAKQRARTLLFRLNVVFVIILLIMITLVSLALYFSKGKIGYWGGSLAIVIIVSFVSLQSMQVLKRLKTFEADITQKRAFIDGFNCLGFFMCIALLACIAGIATAAAIGIPYGKTDNNSTMTSNNTDSTEEDNFINKTENRSMGIVLTIVSAIIFLVLIRSFCYHDEVRGGLGIPGDSKNLVEAKPQPTPSQPETPPTTQPETPPTTQQQTPPTTQQQTPQTQAETPQTQPEVLTLPGTQVPPETNQPQQSGSKTNTKSDEREIELLTAQNKLLKEQNALQKQQLEQMTQLNRNLERMSENAAGFSEPPPPPRYQTLFTVSPPPDYGSPRNQPQDESKF